MLNYLGGDHSLLGYLPLKIQSIVLQVALKERGLPFLVGIEIKKIQEQAISDLFSIVSTKHDQPLPRKSDPLIIG